MANKNNQITYTSLSGESAAWWITLEQGSTAKQFAASIVKAIGGEMDEGIPNSAVVIAA